MNESCREAINIIETYSLTSSRNMRAHSGKTNNQTESSGPNELIVQLEYVVTVRHFTISCMSLRRVLNKKCTGHTSVRINIIASKKLKCTKRRMNHIFLESTKIVVIATAYGLVILYYKYLIIVKFYVRCQNRNTQMIDVD